MMCDNRSMTRMSRAVIKVVGKVGTVIFVLRKQKLVRFE